MTGNRGRAWGTAMVVSATGLVLAVVHAWEFARGRPAGDTQMDLRVYQGAVEAVGRGVPLYDFAAENGDPFTYPPFALLVFWPVSWVSEPSARLLWTAATLAAVAAVAVVAALRLPFREPRRKVTFALAGAAVLFCSAPVLSNLRLGQVSLFLALLCLIDALDLLPRRLRGTLIGVAAAIKLTPLLFVPYLWITGRRRAAVMAGAVFGSCSALGAAVLPSASLTYWTESVFATSRIGNLAATGNQSINGVLIRADVVPPVRPLAWALFSCLVCTVALIGARRYHREARPLCAAAVIGCATIAASPVSWTHHQVWLVLAGLVAVTRGSRQLLAGTLVLVATLFSVGGWLALMDPPDIARENVRLAAAVMVCAWAMAPRWNAAPRSVAVTSLRRRAVVRRTGLAATLALAMAATVVTAASRDTPVVVRVQSAWGQTPELFGVPEHGCGAYSSVTGTDGAFLGYRCTSAAAPAPGMPMVNLGWSARSATTGTQTITGQVGPQVSRILFIPVEGTQGVDVPLIPTPGPGTPLPPLGDGTPVLDGRTPGIRSFAIAVSSTRHSLLVAYDRDGRVLLQRDRFTR